MYRPFSQVHSGYSVIFLDLYDLLLSDTIKKYAQDTKEFPAIRPLQLVKEIE